MQRRMGSQFRFCLTGNDMAEYQRRLEREGDLVILTGISDQSAPRRWPQLPVQEMGKEDLQVFLTREAYLRDVTWYHLPMRDVWAIDSRCSAAVELSRCYRAD